jgi:hypothetical protein
MTTITRVKNYSGPTLGAKLLRDYERLPLLNLRALYEFTEGAGTVLTDTSVNGNHGTITPGAGGWGADGFTFDGAASRIVLPFSQQANFSYFAVVKPDASQVAALGAVVSTWSNATSKGAALTYNKGTNNFGYATFEPAQAVADLATSLNESGLWSGIFMGMNGTTEFAISDISRGSSATRVPGTLAVNADSVCVGQHINGPQGSVSWFKGTIAYLAVWDRLLDAMPSATNPAGLSERGKMLKFAKAALAAKSIVLP